MSTPWGESRRCHERPTVGRARGHTAVAVLIGLLLGGLCATVLWSTLNKTERSLTSSPLEEAFAWCLGRRSKAERLAYWKERTGVDPMLLPTASGPATVTFTGDIAPILFENCAVCHRPGEVTPFSVLSYEDVKPWAWLIGIVTASRYMPPWPPGFEQDAEFVGARRLSEAQIALIQRWLEEGAVEGNSADLPPPPAFPNGWQLGEPDLIVSLPEPFILAPEGKDVYRNLVMPIPIETLHWVKAVEIRPGNKRIVHHGIMQVDRFQAGRRMDAEEPGVGFGGMDMGAAENPGGRLIGWSPGKVPFFAPDGIAWRVGPGTDFILQLHMLPSGKPEEINPVVGLFFTDRPARHQPFGLLLRNNDIDIPAGEDNYVVEESVILPVDVELLGIYPHAHYLAKDIRTIATLPDGTEKSLIHIKDWDFGWQDEYRYKEPLFLPAGTALSMRFSFDNSSNNPRNPSKPPVRVVAGNRSIDEMAVLGLQILPKQPSDEALIREAVMRSRLERYPDSWFTHNLLGIALRSQDKNEEAIYHFLEAQRLNPTYTAVTFNIANALQSQGKLDEAIRYYQIFLELEPQHAKAHNNLAIALQSQGQQEAAIEHYAAQLQLSPSSAPVHFNLAIALISVGRLDEAVHRLDRALELDPNLEPARIALADALRYQGEAERALQVYRSVVEQDEKAAPAFYGMGLIYLERDQTERALGALSDAIRLDPNLMGGVNNLAWNLATHPHAEQRKPQRAIALAELIDTATGHAMPEWLDTLAAAYAADGQFERAAQTLAEALSLLGTDHQYTAQFEERLRLYRNREPYLASAVP